jgi:hypothetical protein
MNIDDAIEVHMGLCCICEKKSATGFAMLELRAPVPGTGWGCAGCGLPMDGAIAALCDGCGEAYEAGKAELRLVCSGWAPEGKRVPIDTLDQTPFTHRPEFHETDETAVPMNPDWSGAKRAAMVQLWRTANDLIDDEVVVLMQIARAMIGAPITAEQREREAHKMAMMGGLHLELLRQMAH